MDRATTRTNALTGRSLRLCNAFLHLIVIVIASKLTPSHAAAVFAIGTVLAQLLAGSGSDEDVLATIVRLAIDSVGVSIQYAMMLRIEYSMLARDAYRLGSIASTASAPSP